jgi:hypothetical protein
MTEPLVTAVEGVDPELIAFLEEIARLYGTQDVRTTEVAFTPDAVIADRRALGADDIVGAEQIRRWAEAIFELLPDFGIRIHVLAQRGASYVARDTYTGHTAVGGGDATMEWYVVDTRGPDGRLVREEIYDTEAQAREAFDRLST